MIAHPKRFLSVMLCLVVILTGSITTAVFADEMSVSVETYYPDASAYIPVTGLAIDEVNMPSPGMMLDDRAVVRTKEEVIWEIPVLWFDDTLAIAAEAQEGRSYLPVPAFFIPQGYYVSDTNTFGGFEIKLSEDLVKLFGGNEIISVYQAETGITYIIPALLRGFFEPAKNAIDESNAYGSEYSSQADAYPEETYAAPENYGNSVEHDAADHRALVDIYCAQTARDAFSNEDLEYLIDLVINRLEPQAVNLLLDKFPAFREGADCGQIGKMIGMYIYYNRGDTDGVPEHENALENAMVYTDVSPYTNEEECGLSYIIDVNAEKLAIHDSDDNPVRDPSTGRFVLVRDSKAVDDFENDLLHEMFHTFMYDYNRTGMIGFNNEFYPDDLCLTDEDLEKKNTLMYPSWFVEGTAACVVNTYQSERDELDSLLNKASVPLDESGTAFLTAEEGTPQAVLANYLNSTDEDRHTSGYLEVLYLSELAARKSVGTSFSLNDDGSFSFSSEKIREGMNSILYGLHEGSSLDQVIADIAPTDESGNPVYSGTDDFENKFISGPEINGVYSDEGDPESLEFTANFLTYMRNLSQEPNRLPANGSILFGFEEDFNSPLDSSKGETSDFYVIVESNTYVGSTVSNSEALKSGGKSDLITVETQDNSVAVQVADAAENVTEGSESIVPQDQAVLSENQEEEAQQDSVLAAAEAE